MTRHLVYLIDGTWMLPSKNAYDSRYTNIHLMNHYLDYLDDKGRDQIVHYKRGLGAAQYKMKRVSNLLQGITGQGIWNDIEEIYINICSNYKSSDNIYLFGFSRGAVICRVVAGLIGIGVLHTNSINFFSEVVDIYRKQTKLLKIKSKSAGGNALVADLQKEIDGQKAMVRRRCHQQEVKVEFLGLFDSVIGGRGLSRDIQELNIVASEPAHSVKSVVHLLAIDEERWAFDPVPFMEKGRAENFEQIWLPGTHGDVGGGSKNDQLSNFALLVMIDRIKKYTNLRFFDAWLSELFANDTEILTIESEKNIAWYALDVLHPGYSRAKQFLNCFRKKTGQLHPFIDVLTRRYVVYKSRRNQSFYNPPRLRDNELQKLNILPRSVSFYEPQLIKRFAEMEGVPT